MHNTLNTPVKLLAVSMLSVLLLFANGAIAEEDWEYTGEIYGWLPNIDVKTEGGDEIEITLSDILENLDFTAMLAGSARKGKWSFATDIVYLDMSNSEDRDLSRLLAVKKIELESWIVTPTVGYTVHQTDKLLVDLYAGARYLWLETALTLDLTRPGPRPDMSDHVKASGSNWDAIVGVRGNYRLSDKWYFPYSVNAGAGDSDFTWQANAAFAYEFQKLATVVGWRYLTWDNDGALTDLTINGPYVGVLFRF